MKSSPVNKRLYALTLFVAIAIAVLAVLPLFTSTYITIFLFILFTYLVMAESFDILAGYTGYVNLGHCIAFGVGAYTFAILFTKGMSVPAAIAAAVMVTIIYAFLISFPIFKLRGPYFTIGTLGLAQLALIVTYNLRGITGGSDGLQIPAGDVLSITYYIALATLFAVILTHYKLGKSRFGVALRCILGDELVAQHTGIHVFKQKVKAFILSSIFAGFIGAIFVWNMNYVEPTMTFGITITFLPITASLFGGRGTLSGPLVGTILIMAIQEVLWANNILLSLLIYGIILMFSGIFIPEGLVRNPWIVSRFRGIAYLLKHKVA